MKTKAIEMEGERKWKTLDFAEELRRRKKKRDGGFFDVVLWCGGEGGAGTKVQICMRPDGTSDSMRMTSCGSFIVS